MINEYLHLGSSTEHCLQSLHEVLHLRWEGCVLGEGEEEKPLSLICIICSSSQKVRVEYRGWDTGGKLCWG